MEGNIDVDGNLSISGTAQLDVSSSNNSSNIRNITVAGNWSNSSSNADPFIERTSTLSFDGSSASALTCSVSGGESFYNLTIAKSSSSYDLTLSNAAAVSNSLTLTTGHIISSSSAYLIMGASCSLGATPTDGSHVSGPMQKVSTSTSAFAFPIGKNSVYRWLEITPTSTSSTTYTCEYFFTSPSNNTTVGTGIDHVSDVEYWDLARSGAADAAVKLSWNSSSAVSTNTSDLLVAQWSGSQWVNRCGGGCSLTGGSTTSSGSLSAGSISTFGNPFTLASPNTNNDLGTSRYSVANGNWSSTSTWAKRSGGTAGASVPGSTNKVIIEGCFRVDVDASLSCQEITIGNSGTGTLDFNATSNTVSVTDAITINSNGDVEGTNAAAALRGTGDIVLNADITSESGGGNTTVILRRYTTGSKTLSGTGSCYNLDIDATTTNSGTITVTNTFQGSSTLTNTGTLIFKGTNANFDGTVLNTSTTGNTVEFNNSTAGFNLDEKSSYYNLTLSGNGTKDFNNTNATINGNLTINSGSTLDMETNDEDLVIKGNFINYGTFTASTSATKEVTFSGSSEQQITSNGSCFYRLYIANTSSTGVVFQDAACISSAGKIDLSDGYLYLGNYNLTLNGTATSPTSATSASFIVTNGTGSMSAVCGNITFPLGSSGSTSHYTPVTINNSGTSDTYSVRICDNASSSGACGGTALTSGVVNKTWQISEAVSGGSNVALTLQWNAANEGTSFTRTSSMISHYYNSAWNAEQTATAASGSGPYSLSVSGLTSFSPYAVMSSAAPLPVELISFEAEVNDEGNVELKWTTASEINNDHFVVERSKDGQSFEPIATVTGAGNSNSLINYTNFDKSPLPDVSFYRLKQIDFDGSQNFSKIVAVNLNVAERTNSQFGFSIYPNPSSNVANLMYYNLEKEEQLFVQMIDLNGKVVFNDFIIAQEGSLSTIDVSYLPSGIYFVKGHLNGLTFHQKLVVTTGY